MWSEPKSFDLHFAAKDRLQRKVRGDWLTMAFLSFINQLWSMKCDLAFCFLDVCIKLLAGQNHKQHWRHVMAFRFFTVEEIRMNYELAVFSKPWLIQLKYFCKRIGRIWLLYYNLWYLTRIKSLKTVTNIFVLKNLISKDTNILLVTWA